MKKKNGFTVVELIVSFSLTLVVVYFLFQIILIVKDMYVNNGIKSALLNKQAIMNEKIYSDFRNKEIQIAKNCGMDCLLFIFKDGSKSILKIEENNNLFHYGDYTTKLADGSKFEPIEASVEKVEGVTSGNDSILRISIPITSTIVEGNYGINAIYQYQSSTTSISDITFIGNEGTTIYLKGESEMTIAKDSTFTDPGVFTIQEDGQVIENDARIVTTGTVNTSLTGTYTITYELKVDGITIDKRIRKVIVE